MGSKKFRASRYPVVIRIIERTVIATCPDFNFPLPVTIYLGTDDLSDPAVIQKIGRAVRLAYAQIEALLSDLNDLNEEHPRPRGGRHRFRPGLALNQTSQTPSPHLLTGFRVVIGFSPQHNGFN